MLMRLVGNETTASCLMFILLELARNPDVQTRLRLEAKQASPCRDFDSLQKLEYLDAVIKEGYVLLHFAISICKYRIIW